MPYKVEEHKIIKVGRGLRTFLVHSPAKSRVSDEIKSGCLAYYQIWSENVRVWRLLPVREQFQCLTVLTVKNLLLMSSLNLSTLN